MKSNMDNLLITNGYSVKKYYFKLNLTIIVFIYSFSSFIIFGLDKSPSSYYFFLITLISLQYQMGVFVLPMSFLNTHFLRILRFHNVKIIDIFKYFIINAFSRYNNLFLISIYLISSYLIKYYSDTSFIEVFIVQIIGIILGFTILAMSLFFIFKRNKIFKLLFFIYNIITIVVVSTLIDYVTIYLVLFIIIIYSIFMYYITHKLINRMDVIDL